MELLLFEHDRLTLSVHNDSQNYPILLYAVNLSSPGWGCSPWVKVSLPMDPA